MLGPYYRGDSPIFSQPVEGAAAQVDILLRDPVGTEVAHATTYNAVTELWETAEVPLLVGGKNWYWRANVRREDDSLVTTKWEMFEVYGDPFVAPYAQPE